MNTQKVDGVNILLIFVSLLLAYQLPFGLFLFSYAALGPLHYITELNWLKQKNYFVKATKWVWVLIWLSAMAAVLIILKLKVFHIADQPGTLSYQLNSNNIFNLVLLTSLVFAAGIIYLKKAIHIILYFIACVAISYLLLNYVPFYIRLFCIFLPTIIHVYLFTLLFMIAGTLNTKSTFGIIAIILLILSPVAIFAIPINAANYQVTALTQNTFRNSGFYNVNSTLAKMGGLFTSAYSPFRSATGIKIQVFIAFCYTYHYLNWFSKTTVIGWSKNISIPKLATIIVIWLGAIALYWYNYQIGFTALFFLSTTHVLLEFPLNVKSFTQIFGKLRPGNYSTDAIQ